MAENNKTKPKTVSARYIYLDVVGFTKDRDIDSQAEIIKKLNTIVEATLEEYGIPKTSRILIPTGDGMCIALLRMDDLVDVDMQIALCILYVLDNHNNLNATVTDRQFQIRIGLNYNVDNLITDINGNENVAGSGISIASRIMGLADGNQIIVSDAVYQRLKDRKPYMGNFKTYYNQSVKHGLKLTVHQYVGPNDGLNIDKAQS